MAECIERKAALDAVHKCCDPCGAAVEAVLSVPAADVAPVVRCRDCKHSYEDLGGLCCSYGPCVDCHVPPDFWCANGRRREDDHAQD